MIYGLKNTLNSKGQKKNRWGEEILVNKVEEGERRKRFKVSEYFSVSEMNYVSSIFIEKIYVKLWEQVIHILYIVQK